MTSIARLLARGPGIYCLIAPFHRFQTCLSVLLPQETFLTCITLQDKGREIVSCTSCKSADHDSSESVSCRIKGGVAVCQDEVFT